MFEQDVDTKKVTRILDLVPQTARLLLRHSAMGQTATHGEKVISKELFSSRLLLSQHTI